MSTQLTKVIENKVQTLQKIISIKNIGRFKSADGSGDVSFSKCTLLFAENGRGKTTLCSILRSLAIGDSGFITGRKTLGCKEAPEVLIRLSNENIKFQNGKWGKTWPQILVYDNNFVTENIYSGEEVNADHRRNLFQLIIGQKGVELAKQERELTQAISDKQSQIREFQSQIQRNIPQDVSLTVEQFIQLDASENIEIQIQDKKLEQEAVLQSTEIQKRSLLFEINVPSVPDRLALVLNETLEGITQETERRVKNHISLHRMDGVGETWLSKGLTYIENDTCPFCTQSLSSVDVITIYQAYFSEEYNRLKTVILDLKQEIERLFGEQSIAKLQQIIQQNETHIEFWVRYCSIDKEKFQFKQNLTEDLRLVREAIISRLNEKIQAPLDPIQVDAFTLQALEQLETLSQQTILYNQQVASTNTLIKVKKSATQDANLKAIQDKLNLLIATKNRYLSECEILCKAFQKLLTEKTILETQKKDVRHRLDEYTDQAIEPYEHFINRFLDQFNAGYRIKGFTYSRSGGAPNTSYQILINETPVSIGSSDAPMDTPCFKNTLSAGDKSTLALAFFLARLEQDPDRANRIVVFDDPFTSQDSFRRNSTVRQIKNSVQNCAQVIVLSHDMRFLHEVWEKLEPSDRKALWMVRAGEENTNITSWDIEKAVQTKYHQDLNALKDFLCDFKGTDHEVIQKIRTVLEAFCKTAYPSQFNQNDSLGGILGKIREAGDGHPLACINDILDELNDYTQKHHHGGAIQSVTQNIDSNELQGYVRKTLKCVGLI